MAVSLGAADGRQVHLAKDWQRRGRRAYSTMADGFALVVSGCSWRKTVVEKVMAKKRASARRELPLRRPSAPPCVILAGSAGPSVRPRIGCAGEHNAWRLMPYHVRLSTIPVRATLHDTLLASTRLPNRNGNIVCISRAQWR